MPGANDNTVSRVVLEVTGACNHRCRHCYNVWLDEDSTGRGPARLSRAQANDLITRVCQSVTLQQVALSGGEPMLVPHLPEIVCDLADRGITGVVITNGSLLTRSRLRRFPQGTPFEVTLFSTRAELHNQMAGRSVFARILEGLVRLEEHGGHLVVGVVMTRANAREVSQVIELGIALGAQAVMLNRVNLSRHTLAQASELVPTLAMLRDCLGEAERASVKYGIPVMVSVPIPPCTVDPLGYPKLHFGWCPRGGKESYYTIGWDGLVRPCNHSSRVLGDLRKNTLAELIAAPTTRQFWMAVPEVCRSCDHPLRSSCLGGCPAAADECYGTGCAVDPFVDFAGMALDCPA